MHEKKNNGHVGIVINMDLQALFRDGNPLVRDSVWFGRLCGLKHMHNQVIRIHTCRAEDSERVRKTRPPPPPSPALWSLPASIFGKATPAARR